MGSTVVTRRWPPPAGTSEDVDVWQEEYFVDFTTQSSGAIAHNATTNLGTRFDGGSAPAWLAEEDNSGDDNDDIGTLEWVSGQGLKATPIQDASNSNLHDSIDAPCLSVELDECMPTLTNRDVICVQVFVGEPVTIAADHDGYGIVLYKPASDLTSVVDFVYMRNYHASSTRKWRVAGKGGAGTQADAAGGISEVPAMIEIVLYPGGHAVCSTSASSSVTQKPLSSTLNRGWCRSDPAQLNAHGSFSEPSWTLDKSTMRLGLVSYKHASGTSFYTYFKKVRILRLAGKDGGLD
tara:strand:- start:4 stop:882 length:879 start_codon:yes stop_codon:yes gene_type:complete